MQAHKHAYTRAVNMHLPKGVCKRYLWPLLAVSFSDSDITLLHDEGLRHTDTLDTMALDDWQPEEPDEGGAGGAMKRADTQVPSGTVMIWRIVRGITAVRVPKTNPAPEGSSHPFVVFYTDKPWRSGGNGDEPAQEQRLRLLAPSLAYRQDWVNAIRKSIAPQGKMTAQSKTSSLPSPAPPLKSLRGQDLESKNWNIKDASKNQARLVRRESVQMQRKYQEKENRYVCTLPSLVHRLSPLTRPCFSPSAAVFACTLRAAADV